MVAYDSGRSDRIKSSVAAESTMGKGSNASKTKRAREDNAKRAAAKKGGGGGKDGLAKRSGATAQNKICKVCRQSFLQTASDALLQTHVDAKHSGKTIADCF